MAIDCFMRANSIQRHDATYMQVNDWPTSSSVEARDGSSSSRPSLPSLVSPSEPCFACNQLGKVYQLQDNFHDARKVYEEALEFSPGERKLYGAVEWCMLDHTCKSDSPAAWLHGRESRAPHHHRSDLAAAAGEPSSLQKFGASHRHISAARDAPPSLTPALCCSA